jgi:hypothetical protein
MARIFLSYARADDEPFVRRLRDDLVAAGFDVWFDRLSMPSRSLTFLQEIRDAIAACDRLVLIVGPKAVTSDYVRQEWQFAYFEADKIVTPILRVGDHSLVPDELRLLHCEDLRNDTAYVPHRDNLVRILRERPPPLGRLIGVPSLPPHFLPRGDALGKLRDALRAGLDRPAVVSGAAARVGVHGMAGIGKSVLAAALARDRKVREAFPDGVVWVRLGVAPDLLLARMQGAYRSLGGNEAFATEREGKERLKALLKDRAVLLVLDDVWCPGDLDAFDVCGPRCRALITTRDAGLLRTAVGTQHVVELLSPAEAARLLAAAAGAEPDGLPAEAGMIVGECGRLPLAVALCGGMVRAGRTWGEVLAQLRQARIDRIADHHAEPGHRTVWDAIHASVAFLRSDPPPQFADAARRFLELAVFSTDAATPEAAVRTLWSHTGGLDDWGSQGLLLALADRSLVHLTTAPGPAGAAPVRHVTLHDLVHDYVQRACGDPQALHEQLLAAYRPKCPGGWASGPNDGYFLEYAAWHLEAAGRTDDVHALLAQEADDGRNAWFGVRDFHGQLGGFLNDVRRGWRLARAGNDLALQGRYALIVATIHSLAGRVTLATLPLFAARRAWSPRQALTYAASVAEPKARARALASLGPYLTDGLADEALTHCLQIDDPNDRMWAVAGVASYVDDPPRAWESALAAAESIADATNRAQAILGLSLFVPGALREAAVRRAIACAERGAVEAVQQLGQAVIDALDGGTAEPVRTSAAEYRHQLRQRATALEELLASLSGLGDFDNTVAALRALGRYRWLTGIARWLPRCARFITWPAVRWAVRRIGHGARRDRILKLGRLLASLRPPDLSEFDGRLMANVVSPDRTTTEVLLNGASILLLNRNASQPWRYFRTTIKELKPWLEGALEKKHRDLLAVRTSILSDTGVAIDGVLFEIRNSVATEELASVLASRLASAGWYEESVELMRLLGVVNMVRGLARDARRESSVSVPPAFRDFFKLFSYGEISVSRCLRAATCVALMRLWRAVILRALPRLPVLGQSGRVQRTLCRTAGDIWPEGERARAIRDIGPLLTEASAEAMADVARGMECAFDRASALASLAAHVREGIRHEMIGEVIDALSGNVNDLDVADLLAEIAPLLSGDARNRAVNLAWDMEDPLSKARALAATGLSIAPHEMASHGSAHPRPASEIGDRDLRAFTRVLLAPHLQGPERDACAGEIANIVTKSALFSRARMAVAVARAKGGDSLAAVGEARVIPDAETRLHALLEIVPFLTGQAKALALEVALESAEHSRASGAARVVSRFLPHAGGDLTGRFFHAALARSAELSDEAERAAALIEIARATPRPLPAERVRGLVFAAKAIKSDPVRDALLEELIDALPGVGGFSALADVAERITPPGRRARVLCRVIETLRAGGRADLLGAAEPALRRAVQAIDKITDPWKKSEALVELCQARPDLADQAVGVTRQLRGAADRLKRLCQLLPCLRDLPAAAVAREILSESQNVDSPSDIAEAVIPLLSAWPPDSRDEALALAVGSAERIPYDQQRCAALTRLLPELDEDRRRKVRGAAYDAAGRMLSPEKRIAALLALNEPEGALAVAQTVGSEKQRVRLLLGSLPKFPTPWKEQAYDQLLDLFENSAPVREDERLKAEACGGFGKVGALGQASRLACALKDHEQRRKQLRDFAHAIKALPAAEARAILSDCLELLSQRGREALLGDLGELLPALAAADEGFPRAAAEAVAQVGRWWP